jgi:hypothetical protein
MVEKVAQQSHKLTIIAKSTVFNPHVQSHSFQGQTLCQMALLGNRIPIIGYLTLNKARDVSNSLIQKRSVQVKDSAIDPCKQ